MQTEQIVMLGILLIVAILTTIITIKRHKVSGGEIDVMSLLLKYFNDIMDVARSALDVLETDRSKFESDKEFYDALSSIVMKDLREFLIQSDLLPKEILKLLTEDVLSELVQMVVTRLKDEAHTKTELSESINITEEIYHDTPIQEGMVDILPEINNILENANKIDPWDNTDDFL